MENCKNYRKKRNVKEGIKTNGKVCKERLTKFCLREYIKRIGEEKRMNEAKMTKK